MVNTIFSSICFIYWLQAVDYLYKNLFVSLNQYTGFSNWMQTIFIFLGAKEKKTKTSEAIHSLAMNGLLYLDTRTDFWRQQKPMYARKRDRELQQAKMAKKGNADPVKFTLMKLREIDDCKYMNDYLGGFHSALVTSRWNIYLYIFTFPTRSGGTTSGHVKTVRSTGRLLTYNYVRLSQGVTVGPATLGLS